MTLAEEFEFFASSQCEGRSPTYARLSRAAATDPALLRLIGLAQPAQRRPSLLFAAIQYLLLTGSATGELAAWFPAVSHAPIPAADPGPAFRDFCTDNGQAILDLIAFGATQTNEVRRCASLLLALDRIGTRNPQPVGLLELGASAGLNLLFDRYRYDWDGHVLGAAGSPVRVSPALHNGVPTPVNAPEVSWRLGADLAPVDIRDDDAVTWLRSFIWPEQAAERDRLRAAVTVARADPPAVVRADAVVDLPALLSRVPDDLPVCVFHASLLTYVDSDQRPDLFRALRRPGVSWVYLEAAGLLSGPGAPTAVTDEHRRDRDTFVLGLVDEHEDTVLARVSTYGESIFWLA